VFLGVVEGMIIFMQTTDKQPSGNLSYDTATLIREKIVMGELVPGQKLSETALSSNLNISRNTLREVFRMLTMEGLLRYEPNRGVSVVIPDIASVIDIYRVRRIVECQALSHATRYHPSYFRMKDAVETALEQRAAENWIAVGTANMAFHRAVVEQADSQRLNSMFDCLLAELRLAFGLLRDPYFLYAPYVDWNVKILKFIEEGKSELATAALNEYLSHSERALLTAYTQMSRDSRSASGLS